MKVVWDYIKGKNPLKLEGFKMKVRVFIKKYMKNIKGPFNIHIQMTDGLSVLM